MNEHTHKIGGREFTHSHEGGHEPHSAVTHPEMETDEFLTLRINTTLVSSPDVIAALMIFAADQVRGGNTGAPLYDSAGNQVGSYRIGPAS